MNSFKLTCSSIEARASMLNDMLRDVNFFYQMVLNSFRIIKEYGNSLK